MERNATDGDEGAEGFATLPNLVFHFRHLWQISTIPQRLSVEVIAINIGVNRISRCP
jgi:hypothetical protein